jgi:hypothetical protein
MHSPSTSNTWGNMFKNADPYSAMEAGEVGSGLEAAEFADKAVRQGFIRKVFGAHNLC